MGDYWERLYKAAKAYVENAEDAKRGFLLAKLEQVLNERPR